MHPLAVQISFVQAFASSHEVSVHGWPQSGIGMLMHPFAGSTKENKQRRKERNERGLRRKERTIGGREGEEHTTHVVGARILVITRQCRVAASIGLIAII